ncbi:hypothetical protein NP493_533g00031 [Ridgeia piscesae]|uniref:Uncharacterized protein n=1 Tax=Ridgeia piscesae TaxID=27915 RepID=A0AAD9KW58_RIDPI|nr:hypothetical protein NP493_533g00031 [Ridgeia piscesae]
MQAQVASAQALSDFAPFVYSHHSVGGGSELTQHQALHPQFNLSPGLGRALNPRIPGLDLTPFGQPTLLSMHHSMADRMTSGQRDVVVPNSTLTNELRTSIQQQLDECDIDQLPAETAMVDSVIVSNLEHQLRNALRIKHQYDSTVTQLNAEIGQLQEELCKSQGACNAANIQVQELRTALDNVRDQLFKQEQARQAVSGSKERSDTQLTQLQKELAFNESRVDKMTTDLSRVKTERDALDKRLKKVQADWSVTSRLEVARMKTTIQRLIVQAAARTRSEVDLVRKQCNENLSRLMEELENLEMINGERQAQIDRAMREKRAVEAELEKLYQEGLVQGNLDMSSKEDLVRRACNAERSRDEAITKLDSMRNEMDRLKNTAREQKEALKIELNTLHDRLNHMTQEFELGAEERVNLVEQIDQLKRNEILLKQERDNASRKLTKQLAVMQTEMMQQTREFEVKHQTVEDSHRLTMVDLRDMLSSQQRMCAKWKEECQLVTRKFEAQVSDLRSELADQKRRNDELAEQLLIEYNRNIKRMESRIRDAEQRAANAMVQSTAHNRNERSLVEQRREMKRQLERSLRESSINIRENKEPSDALMMSDLMAQPLTPPQPTTSNGMHMSNGEVDMTR